MARVEIKTNAQLQQMARAGVITSRALDAAVAAARPGVTTAEVNAAFERTMLELGGTSNFYGYYDYPATVCTSVNHEVVHGIPGDYVLFSRTAIFSPSTVAHTSSTPPPTASGTVTRHVPCWSATM